MAGFEDAVRGALVTAPQTSRDGLMLAAYNAPTGERVSFRYREALSQETRQRQGENRYVGVDGVEYQSGGVDDTVIPWDIFFDDPNHSNAAREFRRVLLIPTPIGHPGRIEHPRGDIIEVVVALVRIIDNPTKNTNTTLMRVEFRKQLTLPADKKDSPKISLTSALSDFNSSVSEGFAFVAALERIADRVATAREVVSQVNIITETMSDIINATGSVLADFNAIKTDILVNMGTLLDAPSVLANQLTRLIQFALDAPGDFIDKIKSYGDLYKTAIGIDDDAFPDLLGASADSITLNRINVQALTASTASASMLAATVLAADEYKTRQSAYEFASASINSVPKIMRALEITERSYSDVTTQKKYYALLNTAQRLNVLKRLAYQSTQQLTNKLLTTRLITLQKDRTILQICWDEYHDVSDNICQSLIDVNDLTLEEVALVPAGRTLYI